MEVTWKYYPLSDIYYRSLPDTGDDLITPIVTLDDIDQVVLETMKKRIRFRNKGDDNFKIVPVIFYNENDRLKTMKESPFIKLQPNVPAEDKSNIRTGTQKAIPSDNPNDEVYYSGAPTWYDMSYTITVGCDTWELYRRLCSFVKDGLFGLTNGQRRIQTNDQCGDTHYRELEIIGENSSEDFERNYFQYDLDIQFKILLNIQEWEGLPRIRTVNFDIKNENGLVINSKQIVTDPIVDVTKQVGLIVKEKE